MQCMKKKKLIGPFKQIVTMVDLPPTGPLSDDQLVIVQDGGMVIIDDHIEKILDKEEFEKEVSRAKFHGSDLNYHPITEETVVLPGLIDCHTHICYAGSRASDYARRLSGETYLNIAKSGGGMLDTVRKTRAATHKELFDALFMRGLNHLRRGVTTCEVKSGYGLTIEDEIKMLEIINEANKSRALLPDLIPTCLAAHTCPPEFDNSQEYLLEIQNNLLPLIKQRNLANRVDIFIEESAFDKETARPYLKFAKELGFDITVHADQFSISGSEIAAEFKAISADHLEVSDEEHLQLLKDNNVIAVVLPGASLGLGIGFAPARKMLDLGLSVAISSDWNPGSAPMGDLLTQAILLGVYEKLTIAETLAGITLRAADALKLDDRGKLAPNMLADFIGYKCDNYQEIIYNQGSLRPILVYRRGKQIL